MSLSEKDFIQQFNEAVNVIRDTVKAFTDNSPAAREARIKRARHDKLYFAQTYFPHYTKHAFATFHKRMFDLCDIWNTPIVVAGGRDIGKSVIINIIDKCHKSLYRINHFTLFMCDTQETAVSEFLLPIRAEFEANPRILNDFGDLKTKYWNIHDYITKFDERYLAVGPKMGVKGKHYREYRYDCIRIEDMENINSSKKKAIITRKLKLITRDLMRGVNSNNWQFIFVGNYFSKKTVIHYLLTSPEFAHWKREIFPAAMIVDGKVISLWEEHLPSAMLQKEYDEDPATFRTERLQIPEDDEALISEDDIHYYEDSELPPGVVNVTFIDTSAEKGEEHCYKAIITLGVDIKNLIFYVRDAWIRKAKKWTATERHFELSEQYSSFVDGIEANGFQSTLKEDYELVEKKKGRRLNLKMVVNRENKEVRISRLQSPIQRGMIKFKRNHSDQRLLIDQLIDFPDGDFIDGPDALESAKSLAERFVLKITKKVKAKTIG